MQHLHRILRPNCKRLSSPGIDSRDSIPPVYVVWRAGTLNRVVVSVCQAGNRFQGSLKDLQIRALCWNIRTIYGGLEPGKNRVGGGIDSWAP
jgi:hypothetical protein